MFTDSQLIWHLLAIDYRNKVATLLEEVESLERKVCYFAPEICEQKCPALSEKRDIPPGKEVFSYLQKAIEQLKNRLKRYDIDGNQTPWGEEAVTAADALADYRMMMEDLSDGLRQLTVIEDRFIQQMEARPLYVPSPRIFRRRHEEYQMYLNDYLVNKQIKLVGTALSALFPQAKWLRKINYQVLSSTEFILDSRIVRDAAFPHPMNIEGGGSDNSREVVFYAKHPYWFQILPIMLPETAHEHSHICLIDNGETGEDSSQFFEDAFFDLVNDITLVFQMSATELGRRAWPQKFAAVMIEELIADIAATMVFGEAYLLPLFLQLAAVNEANAIYRHQVPPLVPVLPWWARMTATIEILYQPTGESLPSDTLAGSIRVTIDDYCSSLIHLLPPDQQTLAIRLHQLYRTVSAMIVGWVRPRVEDAFRRLGTPYPLNTIRWLPDKTHKTLELIPSDNTFGRCFTAFGKRKDSQSSDQGWYSLWAYGYPDHNRIPTLGEFLQTVLSSTLRLQIDPDGDKLTASIPKMHLPPWNQRLDQSVPVEYITWAGYMSTVAGLDDRSKTIMGSFHELIGRGMLSGFPAALKEHRTRSRKNTISTVNGCFRILPYGWAAHRSRQLHFVKWRWESFLLKKEGLLKKLTQTRPWSWHQPECYRFWVLGPFSSLLSSQPGFSRRSRYPEPDNENSDQIGKAGYPVPLGKELGRFGEETIICPWMVFDGDKPEESTGNVRCWHTTIQIRIKTARHFMWQRRMQVKKKIWKCERDHVIDPVNRLIGEIGKKRLWRFGDAVFTSLGWSHVVLMLSPRTLKDVFDFKSALQGLEVVDRTQTTLGTLFSFKGDHEIENGFHFQSTLRLGDIPRNGYARLKKDLLALDGIKHLDVVPGIFDLMITWEKMPTFYNIIELMGLGKQEIPPCASADNNHKSLISDIQTIVTQREK